MILKDNCSKKVKIAVKYPLQGFCTMVAHKLSWIFFFLVHKACTVIEPPDPRYAAAL